MSDALAALATRAGVETSYTGWRGEAVQARPDALCAVLRLLGHDVGGGAAAPAARGALERTGGEGGAPPVVVDWDGHGGRLGLRVPAEEDGDWEIDILFESGRRERRRGRLFELPAREHAWPAAFGGVV